MKPLPRTALMTVLLVAAAVLAAALGHRTRPDATHWSAWLGFAGLILALIWAVVALIAARRRLLAGVGQDAASAAPPPSGDDPTISLLAIDDGAATATLILGEDAATLARRQSALRLASERHETDRQTSAIIDQITAVGANPQLRRDQPQTPRPPGRVRRWCRLLRRRRDAARS